MTLSADLVSEWIAAFPITIYVSCSLDHIYLAYTPGQTSQKLHNAEMKHRRTLDRDLINTDVEKYPHPLEDDRPNRCNPILCQIDPADVKVADSIMIGEKMENN